MWQLVTVLAVIGLLVGLALYKNQPKSLSNNAGQTIRGPKAVPYFGNTLELSSIQDVVPKFAQWRKEYGTVFQFAIGKQPGLVVSEPSLAHEVFDAKQCMARVSSWFITEAFQDKGIINTNDLNHHKLHRGIALQGLMRPNVLRNTANIVNEKTEQFLKQLEQLPASKSGEKLVGWGQKVTAITLDVIARAAFSTELNASGDQSTILRSVIEHSVDGINNFGVTPKIFKYLRWNKFQDYLRNQQALKNHVSTLVQDRANMKKEHNDYLEFLMTQTNPETNEPIPAEDMFFDINDIFIAGHETTSFTLTFVLHMLSFHPEWQQKLQEEADQFSDTPSYEDSRKMSVAQAVIKETLRIHPIVPFIPRATTEEFEIRGIKVPPQTTLWVDVRGIHHSAEYFPDPEKFDPSRWVQEVENDGKSELSLQNLAWMPFGGGRRMCVGMRMSMLESKLILCKIFQKYSVRPFSESCEELETDFAPSTRPKKPMVLQFIPRIVTAST